jgi:hypothetical protein
MESRLIIAVWLTPVYGSRTASTKARHAPSSSAKVHQNGGGHHSIAPTAIASQCANSQLTIVQRPMDPDGSPQCGCARGIPSRECHLLEGAVETNAKEQRVGLQRLQPAFMEESAAAIAQQQCEIVPRRLQAHAVRRFHAPVNATGILRLDEANNDGLRGLSLAWVCPEIS